MPYTQTKTTVARFCETCGETFYVYPKGVSKGRFCSRKCFVSAVVLPDEKTTGWRKTPGDERVERRRRKSRNTRARQCRKKAEAGKCTQCDSPSKGGYRMCETHRTRSLLLAVERNANLRLLTLAAYGNKCACCGEAEEEFLQLDHVEGWGKHHKDYSGRKITGQRLCKWAIANKYPTNLRILCASCHASVTKHGTCAHVRKTISPTVEQEQPCYLN